MATTFLLDPRVLDDCVGDSDKDVEIVGEALTYRKWLLGKPGYIFYVSDVDANLKPIIPLSLLGLFHRKKEIQWFNSIHLIDLQYQHVDVGFIPNLSGDTVPLPDDVIGDELVFYKGQFLKGDAQKFKQYGISIL